MKLLLIVLSLVVPNIFGTYTLNDSYPEVDITVEAPLSLDPAKPTEIIFYTLPNGNRIEWTAGKKMCTGDDWHYDIQHLSAQTEFMRVNDPKRNYITVYLADKKRSWTTWRHRHADIIPDALESMISDITALYADYNPSVTLSSHSGGGYFLFEYIRGSKKINPLIHRFVFIDSVYGYIEDFHRDKLADWLKDRSHFLYVLSYQDATVYYEGKKLVSDEGGTWGRSHAMVRDLSKSFRIKEKIKDRWEIYRAAGGRICFKLLRNPEGTIWHTVLVEKNGFIDSNWAGTPREGKGYTLWGERAYGQYIPDEGINPVHEQPRTFLSMLVGTYTGKSGSAGVYFYRFNSQSLEWGLRDTAAAGNPSFIIPDPALCRAYAVAEYAQGGVHTFSLTDTKIELLKYCPDAGNSPCNIVRAGGSVLTSDYGSGTLSAFPILADGTLGLRSFQFVPQKGDGDPASNIHCTVVSPDKKYIFVTDLGADVIYRAPLNGKGFSQNSFKVAYAFDSTVHPGPRHLIFSDDGRFAYLISEKGDCVSVFAYNDGTLTHISTEKAYESDGHGSADIHISPDGRFLYTSHRLKGDGISIFKRDSESGRLCRVGFCPTGKHPRNFAITPDGTILLCACRDDNRIEIYSIDRETGALTPTGKGIDVPAPVCIQLF